MSAAELVFVFIAGIVALALLGYALAYCERESRNGVEIWDEDEGR